MSVELLNARSNPEQWHLRLNELKAPLRDIYFFPEYLALHESAPETESLLFGFWNNGHTWLYPFLKTRIPSWETEGGVTGEWFDIESAYGYGGPLSTTDDPGFLKDAWGAFSSWCAEQKIVAEFIRFHPLLQNERWIDPQTSISTDRDTVSIDLGNLEEGLDIPFPTESRYMVRRAERAGVIVRAVSPREGFAPFLALYRATMERVGASEYYLFDDRYFRLLELLIEKHGWLLAADLNGQWVAAALFLRGAQIMHYHLSASDPARRIPGATNAILHEAARIGVREKMGKIHLGGGRTPDPTDRLLRFKQSIGTGRHAFQIGRRIHNQAVYSDLCVAWKKQYPSLVSSRGARLLCYREKPSRE